MFRGAGSVEIGPLTLLRGGEGVVFVVVEVVEEEAWRFWDRRDIEEKDSWICW